MPRDAISRQNTVSHYDDDYLDGAPEVYARSHSDTSSSPPSPVQAMNSKKKHYCATCGRSFTTSGHLARHSRVHTGERNHKCPFPGCQTRCSRQDNLQQHYRIHLSPGSRRGSSASARAALKKMAVETAEGIPDGHPRSRSVYRRSNPFPPLSAPPSALPPTTFGAEIYEGSRPPSLSPPPDTPPPLLPARPQPHILTASYATSSCSSASPSPHSDIGSHSIHSGIVDPLPVLMHSPQEPSSPTYVIPRSGAISYEEQAKVVVPPISSYIDSSRQLISSAGGQAALDNQRYNYTGSGYTTTPSPVSPIRPSTSHSVYHVQAPPVEPVPYHPRSYESNQNATQSPQAMRAADPQNQSPVDIYARFPSQSTPRHSHSHSHVSHSQPAPAYGNAQASSSTTAPQAIPPLTSERAHQVSGARPPTIDPGSFSANDGSFHGVYASQGESSGLAGAVGPEYEYEAYRREDGEQRGGPYQPENAYQLQPASAASSRYPSPPPLLPPPQLRRELQGHGDARPSASSQYRTTQTPSSVPSYPVYSQHYGASEIMPYLHQPQPVVPVPHPAPEMAPEWGRASFRMRVRHAV